MPGDIKYKDINGDGVIDDNDKVAIGATKNRTLHMVSVYLLNGKAWM